MSTVIIRKADYDYQVIRPIVFDMLASEEAPAIDAGHPGADQAQFSRPGGP
jgi:hypothetical protein